MAGLCKVQIFKATVDHSSVLVTTVTAAPSNG